MKPVYFDGAKAIPLEALDRMLFTELFSDSSDADVSEKQAYRVVAWVYRAIQLRANALSSIPFVVRNAAGSDVVDLPFYNRIPELVNLTEASLSLFGAAYWLKEYNLANRLLDIRWMVASTIEPLIDAHEGITGFRRRYSGHEVILTPEDVCYFWLADPMVELGPGRAPTAVALEAAGLAHNMNQFAKGFFERGAVYPTILTVDGNPPKTELEKLESWWKRLVGGAKSAWDTVALRANVSVETLSQNISDMAMPELNESVRSQIAVAFGIPQTMLEDAANFATAQEHRISFWRDTIVPEATLISGALNEQLFNPFDLEFAFLFEEIEALQKDEVAKTESMVRLVEFGIISATEARNMLNIQERAVEHAPAIESTPDMMVDEDARALDLRRWRTVALKAHKSGHDPAARQFNSDCLTADEQLEIVRRLMAAESREEVRAAFEPPFFLAAWGSYP